MMVDALDLTTLQGFEGPYRYLKNVIEHNGINLPTFITTTFFVL